jgi:hypothetical protein
MPKLPRMQQNMQAHCPLPRGRQGGSLPRVNECCQKWMETSGMLFDVKALLLRYLRGRGTTTCLECADSLDLPPIFL